MATTDAALVLVHADERVVHRGDLGEWAKRLQDVQATIDWWITNPKPPSRDDMIPWSNALKIVVGEIAERNHQG